MTDADRKLIAAHPQKFRRALEAAIRCTREDRRFLGATKLREQVATFAALEALDGKRRSIGVGAMKKMYTENVNLFTEGLDKAAAAAREAVQ